MYNHIVRDLKKHSSSERARISARFFKTGKGEYGEGDVFIGLTVPEQRLIARKYSDADFKDLERLFTSKIHEHRLTALLILVEQFKGFHDKEIVDFYLRNTKGVNNWDLVDLSADKILGEYLADREKSLLYKLAKSDSLWERRISIIATFAFIKRNKFADTLKIAEILLKDKHNLIHKAVGWMLREIGKRDKKTMLAFLRKHHKTMPRVTLSYACERLSPAEKKQFY